MRQTRVGASPAVLLLESPNTRLPLSETLWSFSPEHFGFSDTLMEALGYHFSIYALWAINIWWLGR